MIPGLRPRGQPWPLALSLRLPVLLLSQGKSANFLYLPVFTDDFLAKNCKILLDMTAAGFYDRSRE